MRSLLSILLIGVPVTLILSLVGHQRRLSSGFAASAPAASAPTSWSSAHSTLAVAELQRPPCLSESWWTYLEQAAARQAGHGRHRSGDRLSGLEHDGRGSFPRFNAMSGGFTFVAGGPFQRSRRHPHRPLTTPTRKTLAWADTLSSAESRLARRRNYSGRQTGAHLWCRSTALQELDATTGKFNLIYLKLDDPANTDGRQFASSAKLLKNYRHQHAWRITPRMFAVNNITALQRVHRT